MVFYGHDVLDKNRETIMDESMKRFVGLGGMTTIILKDNTKINLKETAIHFQNEFITGKKAEEYSDIHSNLQLPTQSYNLSEIKEIITEGFVIIDLNRENVHNFIKTTNITITKIPRRD